MLEDGMYDGMYDEMSHNTDSIYIYHMTDKMSKRQKKETDM